jgi:P2-related tail formation protein
MTIPSRVLGAGASPLSTIAICGDGQDNITAAGTNQATATQIVCVMNSVDTATVGTGVRLPPTEAGAVIYIANSGASTIKVYPYEATSTINQGPTASIDKDHTAILFAVTRTLWYSINGTKT